MTHPFIHPAARLFAAETRAGMLSRREFLTRATALGTSAAAAYGLLGLRSPAARAQAAPRGGTLRIQQEVRALKDPRLYDWPQLANVTRGWLEYLVQYNADGSFTPMLLESWEANGDATAYVLRLRPNVTWNDGSPFTAEDVAYNFERWADPGEGNSMATRMTALAAPEGGGLRDGAVTVRDPLTVDLALSHPDIALIASVTDFPAAVVKKGFKGNPLDNPVGTGPYLPAEYEVGVRAAIERNPDHQWWGEGAYLDRIEFIDTGTDMVTAIAAAESGEVDMLYDTVGEYVEVMRALEWQEDETVTAATIVIRGNQDAEVDGRKPYADPRVRRALALAVSNDFCLELGYGGYGLVAENHHVCPIHPEYAEIPPPERDIEAARALMQEAGMMDFEHELVSLDDAWRKATSDAAASQLREAGFNVSRSVVPGATFWNNWTKYPFSSTDWGHRPLGVQALSLAYRTGEPWNETGFSNEAFDAALAKALSIADAAARREVMAELEGILREEGVVIQPFWRSAYRHARPGVLNFQAHPTFEIYVTELALEQ